MLSCGPSDVLATLAIVSLSGSLIVTIFRDQQPWQRYSLY